MIDIALLSDLVAVLKRVEIELKVLQTTIYASPTGNGDGTESNPYNLTTALTKLSPGKTLILKEGHYTDVNFVITTLGSITEPIKIKSQGKVTIDCISRAIIRGSDITVEDIEFYTDSWVGDRFMNVQNLDFSIEGPRSVVKNCIIHDFSNVGLWSNAPKSTIQGCLIYNIGYSNGSQGHTLYTQNADDVMNIKNNIFFAGNYNSAFCLHLYGSGGARGLRGYNFYHNIFNGGRNLIGSPATKVSDITFNNNVIMRGNIEIGSLGPTDPPHEVNMDGNTMWDANFNIKRAGILNLTNSKVTFSSGGQNGNIVNIDSGEIDYNRYRFYGKDPYNRYNVNYYIGYGPNALKFITNKTGFEEHSTEELYFNNVPPNEIDVNIYEETRANVAIANYNLSNEISVNLTGLSSGNYRALNAQNPIEGFDFNYTGELVKFPMTGWTRSIPIGTKEGAMTPDSPAWLIYPKFGIFYIVKK